MLNLIKRIVTLKWIRWHVGHKEGKVYLFPTFAESLNNDIELLDDFDSYSEANNFADSIAFDIEYAYLLKTYK